MVHGVVEEGALLTPVFVVGPPRSGVNLVGEALRTAKGIWSRDSGAADFVGRLAAPAGPQHALDRLTSMEVGRADRRALRAALVSQARDRDDRRPGPSDRGAIVDAALTHALRVAYLAEVFPTAKFIVVHRAAPAAVSSMIEGWQSQYFVTRPELSPWRGLKWSFPLIEGWRDLVGLPVEEIAVRQWAAITDVLVAELAGLPSERWAVVGYADLCSSPDSALNGALQELRLPAEVPVRSPLPFTGTTVSAPAEDKWRSKNPEIEDLLAPWSPLVEQWDELLAAREGEPRAEPSSSHVAPRPLPEAPPAPDVVAELDFQADDGFTAFLEAHALSILASTYRSGRLISFGAPAGSLQTDALEIESPMGMAKVGDIVAVGTRSQMVTFRNDPAAAKALASDRDGCFLPRTFRTTGHIGTREVAFVAGELWAVSSQFSCLVTMALEYSFQPRWYPPFITQLTNEDRCHLNGLAATEDRILYVSALGETNAAGGWRDNKLDGGVIIDVTTGATVIRGLCMPHSPRWHRDRLWALESGKGQLVVCDPNSGGTDVVAEVPGFARGLQFVDDYAVIGLSQLRDSVFRGLPIVENVEPECGIWVVDTRTGATVGSLRFTGLVQELFDVLVLRDHRSPAFPSLDSGLNNTSFLVPPDSAWPGGRP